MNFCLLFDALCLFSRCLSHPVLFYNRSSGNPQPRSVPRALSLRALRVSRRSPFFFFFLSLVFSDPLDVASSKVASSDVATSTSSFSQKPLHPAPACQLRSLAVQPVPRQVLVAEDHLLAEPYGHLGHRLQGHAVQVGPVGGPQVRDRDGRRPDGQARVPRGDRGDGEHQLSGLLPADLVEPLREGDGRVRPRGEEVAREGLGLGGVEVGEGAVAFFFFF